MKGDEKMFGRIEGFLLSLFTDFQTTFFWIFGLGLLFCSVMAGFGGDDNAPKFKKGIWLCVGGLILFLLAKPAIEYVKGNL